MKDGNLLKGYVNHLITQQPEGSPQGDDDPLPAEFDLRTEMSAAPVIVRRDSLKALFFVKSFEGNKAYNAIKFFEKNPTIKGLWVRVSFYDHESLEGIVANSIHFLVKPAFLLKPPDPQSNNEILYVVKNSLEQFRVLGVKMDY